MQGFLRNVGGDVLFGALNQEKFTCDDMGSGDLSTQDACGGSNDGLCVFRQRLVRKWGNAEAIDAKLYVFQIG